MRYQNWDVLIFPGGSKIPIQEFKTACHVVQDHETGSTAASSLILPILTCFVPGVPAGFPFRVSVHCWDTPEISRYTQNYSKHPENVMYEARVFIDGKLSGRRMFHRVGPWPLIIESSLDRDRNGDIDQLRFPTFHAELLHQSHWNAGDDLGRIKIVISEGFPRDSVTMPLERVKNVVSFSFQHAPLEVLENSCISWPNPAMWHTLPYSSGYIASQGSPSKEELESHSHSPRRQMDRSLPPPVFPVMRQPPPHVPAIPFFPRGPNHDPLYEMGGPGYRKISSSDVSMTDYASSRRVTDGSDEPKQRRNLESAGAYEQVFEALLPAAPANTPLDSTTPMAGGVKTEPSTSSDNTDIDPELREPRREPRFISGVRSRKENQSPSRQDHVEGSRKGSTFTATNEDGSKRKRIISSSAAQPQDSPS